MKHKYYRDIFVFVLNADALSYTGLVYAEAALVFARL